MYVKGLADHLRTFPDKRGLVIVPSAKLLHMKVPRTAGTSRKSFLRMYYGSDNVITYRKKKKFKKWRQNITDEELRGWYIFTFVRNPFDRCISIASYFRISVDGFLKKYDKQMKQVAVKEHSFPAHMYAYLGNKQFADYIGKYESLEKDFSEFCNLLGIKKQQKLSRLTPSKHKNYRSYYRKDEKLAKIVIKRYKKDFKRFEYSLNVEE